MKKKLYTKQMKMSKEQKTSHNSSSEKLKNRNEPGKINNIKKSSSKNIVQHQVPSVSGSSSTNQPGAPPSYASVVGSSSLVSTSVTTSSGGGVLPSLDTRQVPNTVPLPKVDVLMKASLRAAFHVTDNLNANNHNSNSSNDNYMSKTSSSSSPMQSLGSDDQVSNNSDIAWGKPESDVNSNVDLTTPLPSTNRFDIEYSRPPVTTNELEIQNTSMEGVNGHSREASPVYHQMERPVQPLSDQGLYTNHPPMTSEFADIHNHVNVVQNGLHNGHVTSDSNDMIRVYDMGPYSHEGSDQQDGGEHLQQTYGHIRSWDQENHRYMDYWRGEEHPHSVDSVYAKTNSDNDVLNNNVDNGSQRPKKNSGRISGNGKMSGSGMSTRRRRKRVQTPVQRSAANMRERRRMCHLNVAFDHLKDHLPHVKDKKKLSRIQTLKAAIYYIHLLQDSLNTAPRASEL